MLKKSREINPLVVLKSTVNMVSIEYIRDFVTSRIANFNGKVAQVIVTGFHGLYYGSKDETYFRTGEECDLWVPDSIAPVIIARLRGMKKVQRTTGYDIMESIFQVSEELGLKHYFYGDTDKTLECLKNELLKKYPKLQIVGTFSPPFRALSSEEEEEHADMINEAKTDILWIGLGLPKQDLWIYRNKERLQIPMAMGVGAAFGFLAKTVKRAPKFYQNLGLEWFYMFCKYPKRTFRRVVVDGAGFICAVTKEEIKRRFTRSKK